MSIIISDLISQATYTITVSTVSDLSNQVEEDGHFNATASSILVTLPGQVTVPGQLSATPSPVLVQVTDPGGLSNNTTIAIGVSIAAHLVMMFITIATTIVIVLLAVRYIIFPYHSSIACVYNYAYT